MQQFENEQTGDKKMFSLSEWFGYFLFQVNFLIPSVVTLSDIDIAESASANSGLVR
jgi:hypothetical protein